jgi:hypothetical protein
MSFHLELFRSLGPYVAAAIALAVFAYNIRLQQRARDLENFARFSKAYEALFSKEGYILKHIRQFNAGTLKREFDDDDDERAFHAMLVDVEKLALLGENEAAPWKIQIYMFAWYAERINGLLTDAEKENKFFELAAAYLKHMTVAAKSYEQLSFGERCQYWKLR